MRHFKTLLNAAVVVAGVVSTKNVASRLLVSKTTEADITVAVRGLIVSALLNSGLIRRCGWSVVVCDSVVVFVARQLAT